MPIKKGKQGFASMASERLKEIAVLGGKAAHAQGKAHEWSAEEAKVVGSKGGKKIASIPGRMAEIGRLGGSAPRITRKKENQPATEAANTVKVEIPSE